MAFPGFNTIVAICSEYVYGDTKTLDGAIGEAQYIIDMMQEKQFLDK